MKVKVIIITLSLIAIISTIIFSIWVLLGNTKKKIFSNNQSSTPAANYPSEEEIKRLEKKIFE